MSEMSGWVGRVRVVAFPLRKLTQPASPHERPGNLLGIDKAKKAIDQKVTQPISGALILAATALLFAVVAIFIGVAAVSNAH